MKVEKITIHKNNVTLNASVNRTTIIGIGDYYMHDETKTYFQVIEISTTDMQTNNITLEQSGSYYDRLQSSKKFDDLIYDNLVLVKDRELVKQIEKKSRYC